MRPSPIEEGRSRERRGRVALTVLIAVLVILNLSLWFADRASGARPSYPGEGAARAIVRAEFGWGALGDCMERVAWRESRFNVRAANWTDHHSDGSRGSFGLFQIGALWRDRGETVAHFAARMFDGAANAALAHQILRRASLAPWGGWC